MASAAAVAESETGIEEMTGLRKAAILLVSMDKDAASQMMKKLSSSAVEDVTQEIAMLGGTTEAQRQAVIAEFHGLALAKAYSEQGGISYARDLLHKTLSKDEADRIIAQIEHQVYSKPFSFLQKTESENLLTFIQDEHPQTIALILAHLTPQKSSEVLAGLPLEKQVEVSNRISRMEQTSPDVIKEVEKGLQHRLSGMMSERLQRVGGVAAVAEMLNLTDRATEKAILEAIEADDPELVEEIRRLMFVFEDILLVNDRGIQAVLKEIENSELILALRTASEELKEKVFANMSDRAVQLIREEMEYMGPVRVRDVEMAQQKIVDVVRRLEDAGEIIIAGRGGESELIV
ncbi:MAG: flagellar motor switch protein FliG [Phycisphaerae bacterium]